MSVQTRVPATLQAVRARGRTWTALVLFGPAFVASVAYVDPGNFATNFAAGAEHGYELVWVIVMANLMAVLVQYLTSKAALATGRSLPELCRDTARSALATPPRRSSSTATLGTSPPTSPSGPIPLRTRRGERGIPARRDLSTARQMGIDR